MENSKSVSTVKQCPKCHKDMEKVPRRHKVYKCTEHGLWRVKTVRTSKRKFNPSDTSTWRATCSECGDKNMEYHNCRYHCMKCGNTLYV